MTLIFLRTDEQGNHEPELDSDAYPTRVNSVHELIILDAHRSDAYVRFCSVWGGGHSVRRRHEQPHIDERVGVAKVG